MLLWLPIALLTAIAGQTISTISWLLFLPVMAYFGSFFLLRSVKVWIIEPLFLVVLGLVLLFRYYQLLPPTKYTQLDTSQITVQQDARYHEVKNARILILGDDYNYYIANQAATPYINWQLAQEDFGELDTYYAVYKIVRNITASRPDYIVDEAQLMPQLRHKAPLEFSRYRQIGKSQLYERLP